MDNILTINSPLGTFRFNSSSSPYRSQTAFTTGFNRTATLTAPNQMLRSRLSNSTKASTSRCAILPLEEERKQVQQLDLWNTHENDSEAIKKLIEARTALQNRLNKQDVVEMQLLERRGKNKIPLLLRRVTSDSELGLQKETTMLRLIKKESDEQFRERCRYSKMYEDELKQTYIQLENDLQEVNLKREDLRKQCSQARVYLKTAEGKFAAWKKLIAEEERASRLFAKTQGQIKMAGFLSSQAANRQQNSEKEAEFLSAIKDAGKKVKGYIKQIADLDEASTKFRRQLLLVKEAQVSHYRSLLSDGKDSRNEGLIWIVKTLWSLGEEVIPEHFPAYLDQMSIEIILFLAQKTSEIDQLNAQLTQFTDNKVREPSYNHMQDRWNNIHSRLGKLKNCSKTRYAVHKYNRKTKERTVLWRPSEDQFESEDENNIRNTFFSELLATEQKIQFLRDCIQSAQEEELKRIAHECLTNKYDIKRKVSMRDLLSCIVGFENVERFMTLISKEQKDLGQKLFHTKTFKFAQRITDL
jgi:hypothetical protein